ncbi:MAG: hypothetical protein ABJR05_04800 [Balneola sp.]
MKKLSFLAIIVCTSIAAVAQPSTEIYLFDMKKTNAGFSISNPVNVSNNTGYDNQPSFTEDGKTLLYASTRDGQTDILWYDIETGMKRWISDTPGGEYSPVLMPDGKHISAVRLDTDGLQLLYKYSVEDGETSVLVPDLKIGYYTWFLNSRLIAFVLGEPATLQEIDLDSRKAQIMYTNPGRSIHYIPSTKKYSFVDKSDSVNWKIMEAVPGNSEWTSEITPTLTNSEDMVWLDVNTIVMGKKEHLYFFDRQQESKGWQVFADLSEYNLSDISRLAFKGGKLAIVVSGK